MAECLTLPILSPAVPVVAADPSANTGEVLADFAFEEFGLDELPDSAPAEPIPAAAAAVDPLQMMIEALSGVSGSLRDPAPRPDQTAYDALPAGVAVAMPSDDDLPMPTADTPADGAPDTDRIDGVVSGAGTDETALPDGMSARAGAQPTLPTIPDGVDSAPSDAGEEDAVAPDPETADAVPPVGRRAEAEQPMAPAGVRPQAEHSMPASPIAGSKSHSPAQPATSDADVAQAEPAAPRRMTDRETVAIDAAPVEPVRTERTPAELRGPDPRTEAIDRLLADMPATAAAHGDEGLPSSEPRTVRHAAVPVVRQIADAMVTARDGLVEIALAPEELGRLRMIVSGPEHNPHVAIWVDRPEVLDHLRRNAAILQECLGDAGLAEASLEFHSGTSSGSQDDRPQADARIRPVFDSPEAFPSAPVAWTPMTISARLDIRI